MDELLTHEHFQDKINQEFELKHEDVQLSLSLIEVNRLRGPQREEDKRDQFSLIFQGPCEPLMSQHQYTLHHDVMGELTMFLVPVGRVDRQHQDNNADLLYEAIFT